MRLSPVPVEWSRLNDAQKQTATGIVLLNGQLSGSKPLVFPEGERPVREGNALLVPVKSADELNVFDVVES